MNRAPEVSRISDTAIVPPHPSSATPDDRFSRFDFLLARVKPEPVISLALRVRREWARRGNREQNQSRNYSCTLISPPNYSSFSLLHTLEFSDGAKWILRIPCMERASHFTPADSRSLRSEVMTMQFIQKLTSIPIPEIYGFDETTNNEIEAPYILMAFMEGFPVREKWFDLDGPTPIEERRLRILDTVAAAMSQLQGFQFEKIGSLQFEDGGSFNIGECRVVDEMADLDFKETGIDTGPIFREIGPFDSSREYLSALLDTQKISEDPFSIGVDEILRLMINCIPMSIQPGAFGESFVLAHPDFDPQNILVSEDGALTAILGWDNVHTVPRSIGYRRYPSWIIRDWDPLIYGYDGPGCRLENSPEELDHYRRRYAEKMKIFLPEEIDFTTQSHLFEAVWIAARSPICSDHIVQKIFNYLFPEDKETEEDIPMYFYETALALAEGTLEEEEEERMLGAFHDFFHVHLSPPKITKETFLDIGVLGSAT